jgi:hypothetical protein
MEQLGRALSKPKPGRVGSTRVGGNVQRAYRRPSSPCCVRGRPTLSAANGCRRYTRPRFNRCTTTTPCSPSVSRRWSVAARAAGSSCVTFGPDASAEAAAVRREPQPLRENVERPKGFDPLTFGPLGENTVTKGRSASVRSARHFTGVYTVTSGAFDGACEPFSGTWASFRLRRKP